jgi:AP-1-like factor
MSSFFDFEQPIGDPLAEQTIKTELINPEHDFSVSQFPSSFSPFNLDNNSLTLDLSVDNLPSGLDNDQTPSSANSISPYSPPLNTTTASSVLSSDTYNSNDDSPNLPPTLAEKRKASVSVTYDEASKNKNSKVKKVDPSVPAKKPGKPGRKIDNTEPVSKRKAQNRAAQRAFRERKEKHLKDLEDRVAELETESRSKNNENKFLKDQVTRLENELKKYRSSRNSNVSVPSTDGSKKFTFEFPFFASNEDKLPATSGNLQLDKSSPLSFNQSPSLISDSSSSQPTPETADTESFCDKLNLACGTTENPIPLAASNPQSTLDQVVINSQKPPSPLLKVSKNLPGSDMQNAANMISPPIFELDFLSEYRDPIFDKEYFSSIDGLTTEVSVFDPLEPANLQNSNISASRQPMTAQETAPVLTPDEDTVPAKTENMLGCTAIWDRISAHPKFSNLDIDGLCAELRTKAKCSETGVVISEPDVNKAIWSIST